MPQVVLCELVWVLDSVYHYSVEGISVVLRDLLRARQLVTEDLDTARTAVERYAAEGGDFADFLIVERVPRRGL